MEKHWSFASDPDVRHKQCHHCNEWLRMDPAAISYQNELYHWYCLLDVFTAKGDNTVVETVILTMNDLPFYP